MHIFMRRLIYIFYDTYVQISSIRRIKPLFVRKKAYFEKSYGHFGPRHTIYIIADTGLHCVINKIVIKVTRARNIEILVKSNPHR